MKLIDSDRCLERQDDLAVIEAAWQRAASGHGTSVVVTGPPGIGKSRLLAEVVRGHQAAGEVVLRAECSPDPDAPDHWPWHEVLRQLRPLYPSGRPEPTRGPGEDPFPFYDATVSLIRAVAQQRPVAIVIDDAHWADAGSLQLADLVCRSSVDAGVLVVVAHRDLEASLDHETATLLARIARHGHSLSLGGLSEAGTAMLMARQTEGEAAEAVVHRVHVLTAGNPLLVEEAVRRLPRDGSLSGLDKLPPSMVGTVTRVLEPVGDEERLTLRAAAVIGMPFSEMLLGTVVSDHVTDLHEVLSGLHVRGFVEPADTHGLWAFADPLLREGLLSELDASETARLHRLVGEALREPAQHPAADPATVAAHFVAAAQHGGPVGPAVELCQAAALEAAGRLDHRQAVSWLEDAVQLTYRDVAGTDRVRVNVLLLLARAQVRAGLPRSAQDTFDRARRLGEQCGDVVAVARAMVGAVDVYRREPGWDAAVDDLVPQLERTVAALAPKAAEHPVLLARLVSAQAVAGALSFDPAAAQLRADEATALAVASEGIGVRHAGLVAARWTAMGPARLSVKTELTGQLLLRAAQTGDLEEEWLALRWRLRDALEAGDPDLVNNSVARSIELAERLGQPGLLVGSYLQAATVALIEGRFDDVLRLHQRCRTEASGEVPEDVILGQELYVSWHQGQVDLSVTRVVGESLPISLRAAVECWAAVGRDDAEAAHSAVDCFFAEVVLDEVPDGGFLPTILCMMAEAVARSGLVSHAGSVRRHLLPLADRCTVYGAAANAWFGSNHLYLGMLATALGDLDDAEQHLDAAQQVHRRMGARCHLVRGDLWRSRVAALRGDQTAVRSLLESVVRKADLLGMTAVAAEARRYLDAAPAPATSARIPARWELCRDGDGWRLGTGTQSLRLRDRRGLGYLHTLLGRPDQEIHVLELAGAAGAMLPSSGVGPALDGKAKAAYRQRVEDLRDQVAEGERWGDPARVALAEEELDAIARELARSMGLGGRDRPSDAGERARVSVRKAIRAAIDAIADVAPEAAAHLDATIRTGYYCVHVPDPATPVTWRT